MNGKDNRTGGDRKTVIYNVVVVEKLRQGIHFMSAVNVVTPGPYQMMREPGLGNRELGRRVETEGMSREVGTDEMTSHERR